jgi:hypothetical protein
MQGTQQEKSSENNQEQLRELTAKQIWNRILKNETVRIPNDPILAKQLFNHLNVIKSREKELFLSLGFDFISTVISVTEYKEIPNRKFSDSEMILSETIGYDIKLVAPKIHKKYPAFVISKEKDEPTSSS